MRDIDQQFYFLTQALLEFATHQSEDYRNVIEKAVLQMFRAWVILDA